jgi:AraC family transcriptional regulator, positive regulator of tynA and feaB
VQRWSTSQAPRGAQFTRWRELICQAFLDLTPESDLRDGFTGTVAQWPLGELSIARIDSQRQRVRRTAADIARGPQNGYYANLQLRGRSLMTQYGRSTVLRPGDLAVVDTTEPFAFEFDDDFRQLTFFLPKQLLDGQLLDGRRSAAAATATRVDTTAGAGAAVRHAMLALARDGLPERAAARLAVHAGGILAVALDWPAAGHTARVPHRRLHAAVLDDIDEHLTDDDLSAPASARRLGVSVRLLYAVFAGREHSYAAEVRRRRLARAWRDLQDPALIGLRVIDVAVEAGFPNVSSFHRAFLREYGRTPAELRAATHRD